MTNQQPEQAPAAPSGSKYPRVVPASAFGCFICCIGWVWTLISYFQVCGGANQMKKSLNLQAWTVLIPIYAQIYMATVVKGLNEIIQENGLAVEPVKGNMILNFLFAPVPLLWIFNGYNSIADAMEAKK